MDAHPKSAVHAGVALKFFDTTDMKQLCFKNLDSRITAQLLDLLIKLFQLLLTLKIVYN